MNESEMIKKVKDNLPSGDDAGDLIISDIILAVCDYCNLHPDSIPDRLEPFIRKKAKGIFDYEMVNGSGFVPEVQSIKEGDGSITWAQTAGNTKETIYGLSEADKAALRKHRRLRGYGKPLCKDV